MSKSSLVNTLDSAIRRHFSLVELYVNGVSLGNGGGGADGRRVVDVVLGVGSIISRGVGFSSEGQY